MGYQRNKAKKSPKDEFYDYCKRYGYTSDNLIQLTEDKIYLELYETYVSRLKGKRYSYDAFVFSFISGKELKKKAKEIVVLIWQPEGFKSFPVYHPSRIISAPFYGDRVVENWLTVKYVEPFWEGKLHPMNMACQKNKGPHEAIKCLKEFLENALLEYGENLYYLQGDMQGYFDNISHDYVLKLHEGMNPYGYFLLKSVIESWEEPDCYAKREDPDPNNKYGHPKGNLPSQWTGITVLNGLDHKISGRPGTLFYVRIMDDFIAFYRTKDECRAAKSFIEDYLKSEGIGVHLHPTKTKYAPIRHSFNFCGWQYVLKDRHIKMRVRTDRKKLKKKELKRKQKQYKENKITRKQVEDSLTSTFGYYSHGDTKRLVHYMKHHYKFPKQTKVTINSDKQEDNHER